jgi:hypothetical protein
MRVTPGDEKKRYLKKNYKYTANKCVISLSLSVNNKVGFMLRSVLCRNSRAYPMSYDFTPVTERQRLQTIGRLLPHLLGQIKCSVSFSMH